MAVLEAARCACAATRQIPVMCDGDTGYGNAVSSQAILQVLVIESF